MQKRILFSFIILLLSSLNSHPILGAEPPHPAPKDWSILVSSCDKYSALWGPFFKALERHWPELNSTHKEIGIYLIANSKHYDSDRVKTINIPQEKSWSDNMLTALEQVDSKYVLLFLEDYWVTKIDHQRLRELMDRFEKEDAAHMELLTSTYSSNGQVLNNIEGVVRKHKFQNYRASLQLALWEKKALQQILRSGESAWAFEMAGSIRSSGYPKPFLGMTHHLPIDYLNATNQGHITPAALEFAQKIDDKFVNTLPVLGKYNWRLMWQGTKHRVGNVAALIKRNVLNTEANSYRYVFQEE